MWTATFWKDAVERAVKTAAQTLLGIILATSFVIGETDWGVVFAGMGIATAVSIVTSLLSSLVGSSNSASIVDDT